MSLSLRRLKRSGGESDNGRVLGFDNAHDYHHRHCMGDVHPAEFTSYEATLERFQREWLEIVNEVNWGQIPIIFLF